MKLENSIIYPLVIEHLRDVSANLFNDKYSYDLKIEVLAVAESLCVLKDLCKEFFDTYYDDKNDSVMSFTLQADLKNFNFDKKLDYGKILNMVKEIMKERLK